MKTTLQVTILKVILIMGFLTSLADLKCQVVKKWEISGQLIDQKSKLPVSFATVALKNSDSLLVTGAASDINGKFIISPVSEGNYVLIVSAIGYLPESIAVSIDKNFDAGTIYIQEKAVQLNEIVVSGERKKAEAAPGKIAYFINKKMLDASANGADLVAFIPGIQVDMMKNISLGGSQNIVILVDGKERERNFLSQLDPSMIDKVEVTDSPDSRYDAGLSGVINIILKKDRESGINGHIYAEVPVSVSDVYISPTYSLNYGFKKLNLFTSYNGDMTYLNLLEHTNRSLQGQGGIKEIISEQDVRQKNWSHRFHYGFDYFINERNQVNFYAYYNPYSRELDGFTSLKATVENTTEQSSGTKDDTDINRSGFYSIYYKHAFSKPGNEIEIDFSTYNFKAENSTVFTYDQMSHITNRALPGQKSGVLKIDYTSPLSDKLKINAGIKIRLQSMNDKLQDFRYNEKILAIYGSAIYSFSKLTFTGGLRAEKSKSELISGFNSDLLAFMPDVTINYKLNNRQNFKLSYNRTAERPGLYDMNPNTFYEDPFSIKRGNPYLNPEFWQNLSLGYSDSHGSNFYSIEVYYRNRSEVINNYYFINDAGFFETGTGNLGSIQAAGAQVTGSLKIFKIFTINPYLNLFNIITDGNRLAKQYLIADSHKIAFQSGVSIVASFRHEYTASLRFQYNSPNPQIQEISFSDPLYFLSLEKSFNKKFKAGIKTALPFVRSFRYHGTKITGYNLSSFSAGDVQMSAFPVWLSLRYQFKSGKNLNKIDREKETFDNKPRKGF